MLYTPNTGTFIQRWPCTKTASSIKSSFCACVLRDILVHMVVGMLKSIVRFAVGILERLDVLVGLG